MARQLYKATVLHAFGVRVVLQGLLFRVQRPRLLDVGVGSGLEAANAPHIDMGPQALRPGPGAPPL